MSVMFAVSVNVCIDVSLCESLRGIVANCESICMYVCWCECIFVIGG